MNEISIEDTNQLEDPLVIDVRSPSEYAEDHLPGAVNLPVLSDDERDRVGTIHNQDSPFRARREGAKEICRNVPDIIDNIDERIDDRNHPLLLYCWRGGQRSQSLSLILDRIGYQVHRLQGGYKAYRKQVHQYFQDRKWSSPLVIIYGLTGSGKTPFLHRLREGGHSVVDLEGAANHRGSAFGGIGLDEQPSQKHFERRIYQQLEGADPPIFMEGESRKIGRRTIPDPLFQDLIESPRVWLETRMENRVENIAREYPWPECREDLVQAVGNLKERLGTDRVHDLQEKLRQDQLADVIETLLTEYYDPAYEKSCPDREEFDLRIDGEDYDKATQKLIEEFNNP